MIRVLTALAALALSLPPSAGAYCYERAAAEYAHLGVTETLLRGIAEVESSNNHRAMNLSHQDRTRSYDIGLMQINSRWLPTLAQYGITEQSLRTDACQNLLVGAWILASNMQRHGANWDAVGAYNAACTSLKGDACTSARAAYNAKVYRAINRQANGRTASRPHTSGPIPVRTAQAAVEVTPRPRIKRTSIGLPREWQAAEAAQAVTNN